MRTDLEDFSKQLQKIAGEEMPNFLVLSREIGIQKDTLQRWWKGEIIPIKEKQDKAIEVFEKHLG